jgi:serine/threonine-protein kinase RsbW
MIKVQKKTAGSENKSKGLDISFAATLENVDKASKEIKRIIKRAGMKNLGFNIILGIREALINSVIHGSMGDGNKIIRLNMFLEDNGLIVEVEDQGEGFDWKAFIGKKLPSREESGRGLAIMKKSFSSIEYNEKGNRVVMIKRFNPSPFSRLSSVRSSGSDSV